jgi:hypothetical protein
MHLLQARKELENAMNHPDLAHEAHSTCLSVLDLINSTLAGDTDLFPAMQQSLEELRPLLRPGHPARAN